MQRLTRLSILALALSAAPAGAQDFGFLNGTLFTSGAPGMGAPIPIGNLTWASVGWSFRTTTAVTVTHLGVWFEGNPAPAGDFPGSPARLEVGIFEGSSNTLVAGAFATVTPGASTLQQPFGDGRFWYVPIAPVTLAANGTYAILSNAAAGSGATHHWQRYVAGNAVFDSRLTSLGGAVGYDRDGAGGVVGGVDDGVAFDGAISNEDRGAEFWTGPNLVLAPTSNVPEPSTFALSGGAALLLGAVRLRRR